MEKPMLPTAWTDPTKPHNFAEFGDVEIQVVGAPGVAYTPQRSLDGSNFVASNAFDKDGVPTATITAAGIYSLEGGGWLRLTGGSGSTITVRAGV